MIEIFEQAGSQISLPGTQNAVQTLAATDFMEAQPSSTLADRNFLEGLRLRRILSAY